MMGGQAPAIIRDPREQWLLRRRESIGASDVAAILGVDPRRGPFAVYAEKLGLVESSDNEWMAWGRDVEGAIAKGYARKTGRPVRDLGALEIQRHPDVPFLTATLDRITSGTELQPAPADGEGPLELKAVAGMKAGHWKEDPPLHFQVQLQIQMAVTSAQWGSLCAFIGGVSFAWKDIVRHDRFLAQVLPRLEEFWMRVQRRDPPEPDGLPATSDIVRAMYADEDGETLALDLEALDLVNRLDELKAAAKDPKPEMEQLQNRLRVRMGPASFGWLPDGSMLTLRTTKRGAYSVAATSYRALRRTWPHLKRRSR